MKCKYCGEQIRTIKNTFLWTHSTSREDYGILKCRGKDTFAEPLEEKK